MAEAKKVVKDTYLFREGDAPDAMYIVKSGSLAITKTKGNSEVVLAEISTGSMVGEMALFDKKPRSANVKATKDSEVIALPYVALEAQMVGLPVWVQAILKNMNENLREANKKIKTLESTSTSDDRFSPHVINKLLTIFNFVSSRYGQKEGDVLVVPQNRLRNTTIQIFQEATNKMQSLLEALQTLGYTKIEDLGEGKQKISNLKSDLLFEFVDWQNEWLFKQEKDRISITADESKLLEGLIHFGKKVEPNGKNQRKVNLNDIQNDSMKELGYLIKLEEFNGLIEKKVVSEKMMEEKGVFISFIMEDLEPLARNWKLVWDFKKMLK